jgi:type IV pilus assembly protein PilW
MRQATLKRHAAGFSIIELMVAITLGLLILAGLASLFANASAARNELERNSRQIENGRFAIELLSDDLRLAGFYGELNVKAIGAAVALPDPCSTTVADWAAAIPVHVFGYDNGAGMPGCIPANYKPNTDILVVRRVSTCEVGAAGCEAFNAAFPYIQTSRCSNQIAITAYRLNLGSSPTWDMQTKACNPAVTTGRRRYYIHIYYIATDNGLGMNIPTLTRLDFNGASFNALPMVEGIEELQLEYGIDHDGDGNPDGYGADPNTWTVAGCAGCAALNNWFNVVTVRVNLLARNIDPSPKFTDNKTYTVGRDSAGADITLAPPHYVDPVTNNGYRRHAYTGLVRIVNAAQRRDVP